jgi:hypothetical protein
MLAMPPVPSNSTASKKAYVNAAKQFVTAQLNFLSGARLPTQELQGAYDTLSSFLATAVEGKAIAKQQLDLVVGKTTLLSRYNDATLPATFKAPPKCR